MTTQSKSILIPIDFSNNSLKALRMGYAIARNLRLEIKLLFVIEQSGGLLGMFSKSQSKELRDNIESKLSELARDAELKSGNKVEILIKEGKVHSEIVETCKYFSSKFIIMGFNDSGDDLKKTMIGANTSRVIRSASCPVITVKNKVLCHNLRSLLLPLDLSKETRQKVSFAIDLAKHFKCKVKVVSGINKKHPETVKNQLYVQLKQVVNFVKKQNIDVSGKIIESDSGSKTYVDDLLGFAKSEGDIDLILTMTQQEIALVEYFIGSTAQEMMSKSEFPVMTINPKEFGETSIIQF